MGDKKRQSALFKFGFTKNIPHRNVGCSFVEDDEVSLYNCKIFHSSDKKVLSKSIPMSLEKGGTEIEDPQKKIQKEELSWKKKPWSVKIERNQLNSQQLKNKKTTSLGRRGIGAHMTMHSS